MAIDENTYSLGFSRETGIHTHTHIYMYTPRFTDTYTRIYKETYYKESAHVIIEAEKSQDAQAGVPVQRPAGSRLKRSRLFSLSWKPGKDHER